VMRTSLAAAKTLMERFRNYWTLTYPPEATVCMGIP
jgi:hypothetical protein